SLPDTPPDFAATQSTIYDTALTHIALAALHMAAPDVAKKWLQSKDDKLPRLGSEPPDILASVEAIQELIAKSGHAPDVEDVREVDRRLKLCKNPEKVVGSKAYLAKKAEEDKKTEDKRTRKANNETAVVDPFGDALERPKPGLVDYDDDDDDDD
ncbi:hypothetical protein MPER_15533, partial [Moniliophthora perniciosa FA553]